MTFLVIIVMTDEGTLYSLQKTIGSANIGFEALDPALKKLETELASIVSVKPKIVTQVQKQKTLSRR